jgi:3-deoxy-D-manno-octulosonic-acid transferase
MSALWSLYRTLAPVVGMALPWARPFAPAAEKRHWDERLGRGEASGPCDAWVHAASLGEAVCVPPLLAELSSRHPGARFVLTATTLTGRQRLAALSPPTSLAPVDAPQAVDAFFARAQPRLVLLVETELWPHWLLRAERGRVPVTVVSARLSAGSVKGYGRLGAPMRRLVSGLAAVLCQSAEDAERWIAIGAVPGRVAVTGNLKHDGLPAPAADRGAARAACDLDPARPLLVLGNLRPGEGRVVAEAWAALAPAIRDGWQVVAVPRHEAALAELRQEGSAVASGAWRWDARPGVLPRYYAAADVAVVGGTLLPYGGHNPMEPAACGAAVVIGPRHESQAASVKVLRDAGAAIVLAASPGLGAALAPLLGDAEERMRIASAAVRVVASLRGAGRRTVDALVERGVWRT